MAWRLALRALDVKVPVAPRKRIRAMNFQIGSALGVLGSAPGDGTSRTTYDKVCSGKYCHLTH